ncbi:hypothetical protein SEUCBS140593_002189 [Sporothrix eucalyptigena]|uniref:Uncharacterized protein n=1 Tax=Sporothrix eucalyptigena TaxID=1812306 RepID=A0ABP0B4G8_9PEZI
MREILLNKKTKAAANSGQKTPTLLPTPAEERMVIKARERSTQLADDDTGLARLMQMLRAGNTDGLFRWLHEVFLEGMPTPDGPQGLLSASQVADILETKAIQANLVVGLPSMVFSELVRSLDPFVVNRKMDPLGNMSVPPAMATTTPVGAGLDEFGIRKMYSSLMQIFWAICSRRAERDDDSVRLLPNDYLVLIRAAGAASNIGIVKEIWHSMEESGRRNWRQSELYTEFLRTRFLTRTLYVQNDHSRTRVRPTNLSKDALSKLTLPRLYRLDRFRYKSERILRNRFGYNAAKPEINEHLTRILRKTRPLQRVYNKANQFGSSMDIPFHAAYIIALGRSASLRKITQHLDAVWGVKVWYDKTIKLEKISGGKVIPHSSPLYPTAELLEAIVRAFGCNCEISLALKLVTYMSQRFSIQVPDKVWFELLNWASIQSSPLFARQWAIAGFLNRKVSRDAISAIWTVMTSEPYNVKPGFKQYDQLIRSMINPESSVLPALRLMRQMKPFYQAQLREQEEAMMALAEIRAHGDADTGPAMLRMKRTISKKWHMWFCIHSWCRRILRIANRDMPGSELLTRLIPRLVDEFRPFLLREVRYQTPTGLVALSEPYSHSKMEREVVVEALPMRRPRIYRRTKSRGCWRVPFERDRQRLRRQSKWRRGESLDFEKETGPNGTSSKERLSSKEKKSDGATFGIQGIPLAPPRNVPNHAIIDEKGRVLNKLQRNNRERAAYPEYVPLRRVRARDRVPGAAPLKAMLSREDPEQRKYLIREFA